MRLLIALICATIFVLSLTFLGIQRFYPVEKVHRVPFKVFKLDHLTEQETRELFAELNIPWDPKPERPNLEIPVYPNSNQAEKISVLADIMVNPDGSVGDVYILGGNADGKYTQLVKAQIQQQSFEPKIVNGEAVQHQIEEIIELDIAKK